MRDVLGRTDEFLVVEVLLVVVGLVADVVDLLELVPVLPTAALEEEVLLVPKELLDVVAVFLVRLLEEELLVFATTLFWDCVSEREPRYMVCPFDGPWLPP